VRMGCPKGRHYDRMDKTPWKEKQVEGNSVDEDEGELKEMGGPGGGGAEEKETESYAKRGALHYGVWNSRQRALT